MQNEMLKVMAMHVLCDVVASIQSTPFYILMVDEMAYVSNKHQVVFCLRWVDKSLEAHEEFVGLYQVESTQVTLLLHVMHDILTKLNLCVVIEGSVMMVQQLFLELEQEWQPYSWKKNPEQILLIVTASRST